MGNAVGQAVSAVQLIARLPVPVSTITCRPGEITATHDGAKPVPLGGGAENSRGNSGNSASGQSSDLVGNGPEVKT